LKSFPSVIAALSAFIMLILFPDAARASVISGLHTCGSLIIPSLFPFFIAVNLLTELGIISRAAAHFKSGGIRIAAFIIGITGGYPLGAAFIAHARSRGEISRDEGSRLLIFCNNSGPAFIIGAVGCGVFSSLGVGIILYAVHILTALLYGSIFCKTQYAEYDLPQDTGTVGFPKGFTLSVKKSVSSTINICGFVVAFSVITGMFNSGGLLSLLCGRLSCIFGTELHFNAALLSGVLEIGNGIGNMAGLKTSPLNLALAAFLLGWGGISVHFQTLSIVSDTDIKTARYIVGRFVIAVIAAVIAFLLTKILRI